MKESSVFEPRHHGRRHVYVIGDLQGCFAALKALLKEVQFDPAQDFIYFTGDLVARGEDSLSCLRFAKKLTDQGAAATVLGNHDLTLIATGRGFKAIKEKDKTRDIFEAVDGSDLIDWLRHQPLLIQIDENYVLTHAGIPPIWTLHQVQAYAKEVEAILQSDLLTLDSFLSQMYGSKPNVWSDCLQGHERWRVIVNYLTRMRLLDAQGRLDFEFKEGLADPMPEGFKPWFDYPSQIATGAKDGCDILFGHWAALQAKEIHPHIIALDGGAVWGGTLVAFEIKNRQKYSVFNPN